MAHIWSHLLGMDVGELEQFVSAMGESPFRSRQLYRWIYNRRETDFVAMTDLGKTLRSRLIETTSVMPIKVVRQQSGSDGSQKLLFELTDGHRIEGVLIPEEKRTTVCLSSQVGCVIGCGFCATGLIGFKRNLTTGEIVGQLIAFEKIAKDPVTNVVIMGMGEPLLNCQALFKAIRLITDPDGIGISRRRFTVSTVGWIPGLEAMIQSGLNVKLAVSLNGTTDSQRQQLMPMASRFPIEQVIRTAGEYARSSGLRVVFGYLLLAGYNDSDDDAERFIKLMANVSCKINIMEYNAIGGSYRRTDPKQTENFVNILRSANLTVMIRASRGGDIDAACGQLAGNYPSGVSELH